MVRMFASAQRLRRQHAGAVARVHAGLLDVLHDAGDQHVVAVGQRVHVHFGGVFQEAVDQHRALLREGDGLAHVLADRLLVVGDHHGAPAQHVAGPHQHRVADARGHRAGLFHAGGRCRWRGTGLPSSSSSLPNSLRSSARSMSAGSVPMIGTPGALKRQRQVERRLAAELHDHAVGLFGVDDVEHVFERQRLEVQAVAGVVVGGDGLRIAVDHDRLDAQFLQRERSVAAAVVELDPLADAVGAAAQDHDLRPLARVGFARAFVVGVEVRREAFELGGAGIHAAEDRGHAQLLAARAHRESRLPPRSWRAARPRCRSAWRGGRCRRGRLPDRWTGTPRALRPAHFRNRRLP